MNVIIITAKGGNTSLTNKNLINVGGKPVLNYVINAAKNSFKADKIYISTECKLIKKLAQFNNIDIIDRPEYLSQPNSLHKDVIEHAVRFIKDSNPNLNNVVVLLGNTVMINSDLIDLAFSEMQKSDCDSIISGWKAQDDHPYRALSLNEFNYVDSFLKTEVGSNRQSYPDVFYYDQGVWGFNWKCAIDKTGPAPWVWLGKKCKLIERNWVTGRDIHGWIDVSASQWYLSVVSTSGLDTYEIKNLDKKL